MNTKTKVSVIVPVYNGSKHIKTTIESILDQTFIDVEVIVVDDCSTDNSVQIIKDNFGDKVKLIEHEKNMGGPAPTKNTGIKIATGKYCAFMDQDDIWFPAKIEKQVVLFEANPGLVAVFTNGFILNNETGQNIAKRWSQMDQLPTQQYCLERLLRQNFILSTTSAMIKTDLLKEIKGFDDSMKLADDYEMWLRLATKGGFGFIEEPLFQWRFHTKSLSHNEEKHLTDLIYCYSKVDKILGESSQYHQMIEEKLAIFYTRLGNFYLANRQYGQAKANYAESLSHFPDQKILKITNIIFKLSPLLASLVVKTKRSFSQSVAKIDPDWTLVDKSTF